MQITITRRTSVIALATAGLLATVGVGWAAIPGADGQIKGCYATTNGLLLGIPHSRGDVRIVDSAAACRSYEQSVSWSQKGPKGDAGSPGLKGDTGAAGPPGPRGSTGGTGSAGPQGRHGRDRAAGPSRARTASTARTGSTAPTGPTGPTVRPA